VKTLHPARQARAIPDRLIKHHAPISLPAQHPCLHVRRAPNDRVRDQPTQAFLSAIVASSEHRAQYMDSQVSSGTC